MSSKEGVVGTRGVGGASGTPDEGVAFTIIVETRIDAQKGVVGGCSVVVTGVKTDKGVVAGSVAVTGVIVYLMISPYYS